MMKFYLWSAILFSYIASCLSLERGIDIHLSCNISNTGLPCFELDTGLESLNSSTTLYLQPGIHILHQFHLLTKLDNVAILGERSGETRIHCENETGLAFVKMDNLTISNISIDGCGLTGISLRNVTKLIKQFVDLTFFIPDSVKIAVCLAQCTDFQMSDSVIANTTGLGMLAINVWNATLTSVNFEDNRSPNCSQRSVLFPYNITSFDGIGGGAYFLFENIKGPVMGTGTILLEISNCNFMHNAECSLAGYYNVNFPYLTRYPDNRYTIGGGGGLSLFTPQSTHAIHAVIKDSNFTRNHARYGAGAHIGLFIGTTNSSVQFERCFLDENGYPVQRRSEDDRPQVTGGAGVALFLDMLRGSDVLELGVQVCDHCRNVSFTDTYFTRNLAFTQGGGVMAYILSIRLHGTYSPNDLDAILLFDNCIFSGNMAEYGSALHVSQRVLIGADGHWSVDFAHVYVEGNLPEEDNESFRNVHLSAVDLRGITALVHNGSLVIEKNLASGLHLMSSVLYLAPFTTLILRDNRARRGGGAYMDGSTPLIIADTGASVVFDSNSASLEGGAVYYKTHLSQRNILEPIFSSDCFITFTSAFEGGAGSGLFNSSISIEFINNQAPLGSIVFGSTLNSCTWARDFGYSEESLFSMLYERHNSTFKFSVFPEGKDRISSDPHFIEVENGSGLSAFPGQTKGVSLKLLDVFKNEVEAVVTSYTTNTSRNNVTVGPNGLWYYIDSLGATLYARGESNNVTVSLFTASNLVGTNFTITILDCPVGFNYDSEDQVCICDERFEDGMFPQVTCDQRNVQLIVSNEIWMGCEDNEECTTENLILFDCYFQYCDVTEPTHVFNQSDPSTQCTNGSYRTGLMCGKCKKGLSVLYGVDECGECSNIDLIGFLLLHVVLGVVLLALISVLGISIDKGWTNMVILFSNIAYPYTFFDDSPVKFFFLPMRWLSLELGLSICAYREMDSLGEVGLSLLFPAYMYLLMLIFAILCRHFSFFREYFSPTKTLVTLTFLLYVRIFKTCTTIIAAVYVTNLNGTIKQPFRWLVDPNVVYFEGWHCVLGIIAIVIILVYVVWFPLILLTPPSLAYKYGQRFKPFLDAIWAPYRPKFRFWASIRLILRILIVMIPKFGITTLLRGVSLNSAILFCFLYFQLAIRPFSDGLINIVDSFLILVSLFLHSTAFFKIPNGQAIRSFDAPTNLEFFYVAFFVSLSYIVIASTFVWYSRMSKTLARLTNCFRKLANRCCKKSSNEVVHVDIRALQETVQKSPTHSSFSLDASRYPYHHYKNITKVRESILEDQ